MVLSLEPRQHAKAWATRYVTNPLARVLVTLHVSPNVLTLLGLAIAIGAGVLLGKGQILAGGLVMLAGASTDMLDGAVARLGGKASPFGALLDSVADRLAEAAVLGGLLAYYVGLDQPHLLGTYLTLGTLVASFMVSYLRARSEGLGIPADVGIMGRPERIIVLGIGLVAGYPLYALGVIAGLASLTVVQRVIHVARRSSNA